MPRNSFQFHNNGYQMIEELERRSESIFTLKAGTLYPILHTLEQQGMIESYEQLSDNVRPRKYYRITINEKKLFENKKSVPYTRILVYNIGDDLI